MVTKAYIQDVISRHSVRVRIPLYHKLEEVNGSTPNSELSIAPICTLPNVITDPHPGDIVFVSFEENDLSKPVIMGYLSKDNMGEALSSIKCEDLDAQGDVILSKYTTIGEIGYDTIFHLKGLKQNIVEKLDEVDANIDEVNEEIGDKDSSVANTNTLWGSVADFNNRIGKEEAPPEDSILVNTDLPKGKSIWDNLYYVKHNFMDSNTPILKQSAYGNTLPSDPKDGQLYFMPLSDIDFSKVTLTIN